MKNLRARLQAAAAGIVAQHGCDAPNLFAEALAEIERLDAIEADVKVLLRSNPCADSPHSWVREPTTWKRSEERFAAGRRLGEAVGVFAKEAAT